MLICAHCKKKITPPICVLCLTDETESWIEKNSVGLVGEFRKAMDKFINKTLPKQRVTCSICRAEGICNICPSCFIEEASAWLIGKNKKLALELSRIFSERAKRVFAV